MPLLVLASDAQGQRPPHEEQQPSQRPNSLDAPPAQEAAHEEQHMACHSALQKIAEPQRTVQSSTVRYSTVQHSTL